MIYKWNAKLIAALAVLFTQPAWGQNINVLPAGDLTVALGLATVGGMPVSTVIHTEGCEIRTGETGTVRLRALALFDESLKDNTIQILGVEFRQDCWLFFARTFDRVAEDRPAVSLVGTFSLNSSGRLAIAYSRFGSTPAEQAEGLARRLSGQSSHVSPPVPVLPVSLLKNP